MSDKNNKHEQKSKNDKPDDKDQGAEKVAVGKQHDGFFESAFWNSPIGKLVALIVLWYAAPVDKVLDQALMPALGVLAEAGGFLNVKSKVFVASTRMWFRRYGRKGVIVAAGILGASLIGTLFSIAFKSAFGILVSCGLVSIAISICCWLINDIVDALTVLAEQLVDLTGSYTGGVLRTIGFTELSKPHLRLNLGSLRKFTKGLHGAAGISWLTTGILTLLVFIAKQPPWLSCLMIMIAGTFLMAAYANRTAGGSHGVLYKVAVALAAAAFAVAIIPTLPTLVWNMADWVTGWVGDPNLGHGQLVEHVNNGPVVLIAILASLLILCLTLSAYYHYAQPAKSSMFKMLAKIDGVAIVAALICMALFGFIKPESLAYARSNASANMDALHPTEALRRPLPTGTDPGIDVIPATPPNMSSLPPAGDSHVVAPTGGSQRRAQAPALPDGPSAPSAAPAPAPVPKSPPKDYKGKGIDDVLGDLLY